jgi:hypothetical protein
MSSFSKKVSVCLKEKESLSELTSSRRHICWSGESMHYPLNGIHNAIDNRIWSLTCQWETMWFQSYWFKSYCSWFDCSPWLL